MSESTDPRYQDALRSFVDQSIRVARAQQEINRLTAEAAEAAQNVEQEAEGAVQELALARDQISRLHQQLEALGHQGDLDRETIEALQRYAREVDQEVVRLKQKISYWRSMFEDSTDQVKLQAEYDLLKELEAYYRACSVAGYNHEIASTLVSMADMMADRQMLAKYKDVEK